MKFLVGLGNPGERYAQSRHNAGFMMADAVATKLASQRWELVGKTNCLVSKHSDWWLLKPQTFMNNSGQAVRGVLDFYYKFGQLSTADQQALLLQMYVAHDDLDLAIGTHKIQLGKGPKVHNGLRSLYEHLGHTQFWHVRMGVDGRPPQARPAGRDYVLENFLETEKPVINQTVSVVWQKLQT